MYFNGLGGLWPFKLLSIIENSNHIATTGAKRAALKPLVGWRPNQPPGQLVGMGLLKQWLAIYSDLADNASIRRTINRINC
jgi:hypothetical protein